MSVVIRATDVGVRIDGATILDGVSLDIATGEVLAIVGPNGAGKSTLLAVLSGDIRADEGSVLVDGQPIDSIRTGRLARLRSVLTQENQLHFPFTVGAVVEMGRSPWSRTPQAGDDDIAVAEALAATDVAHLVNRSFSSLSGGEKARVSLARVLAQRTATVFLDEPTAALDLRHQEDVMRVAADLAGTGRAVVVVVHDLSLAAAYAGRVALLSGGKLESLGEPAEVLTPERLSEVYGLPVEVITHNGRPMVLPVRR